MLAPKVGRAVSSRPRCAVPLASSGIGPGAAPQPHHAKLPSAVNFKESQSEAQTAGSGTETGKHILLMVDESKESDFAVDWALSQAYKPGDHVTLMRVVPAFPLERVYTRLQGRIMPLAAAAAKRVQKDAMVASATSIVEERYGAKLKGAQVPFKVEVVVQATDQAGGGSLGALVCQKTAALDAGLVVVPEGAAGGLSRWMSGSLVHYLVHHCERAVAVLHRPKKAGKAAAAGSKRNIVLAVDDSPESLGAVVWAADNLYRPGDTFHLLHVIPVVAPAPLRPLLAADWMLVVEPTTPAEDVAAEEAAWRETLRKRYADLLASRGVPAQVDIVADQGEDAVESVARTISMAAESLDAAAVVMVQHPRPEDFGAFLMGDVVDYVVDYCAQPVMLLHGSCNTEDSPCQAAA